MTGLSELLKQYRTAGDAIRSAICEQIDAIRENQKIRRIGENMFTISFSELQKWNVLAPEYFDYSKQKQRLKALLGTDASLDAQLTRLENAAKAGKIQTSGNCTFLLHPDVCNAVREILAGLKTTE